MRFEFNCATFNGQIPECLKIIRAFSTSHVGYFVPGAPIMITENISTICGLANGVSGKMYDFIYGDYEKYLSGTR